MKVRDIIDDSTIINEISLKHAVASGIIGASMLGAPAAIDHKNQDQVAFQPAKTSGHGKPYRLRARDKLAKEQQEQAQQIADKYRIDLADALQIVKLAYKYEKPSFPKAQDILAIVGIESGYNPEAESQLKHDPAIGLMQIRPGIWNLDAEALKDPDYNVKVGSQILHTYYQKLKNPDNAIQAYNIGITNFRNGGEAPRYLNKYNREMSTTII